MINLRFVPIDKWPGEPTKLRHNSPFRSGYLKTLDLLESELSHLRAKEIILQAGVRWEDLRNDGWPRTDAKFRAPGIILTFETRGTHLSFPCDRYGDWQANLRAIALSLEALRAVDRYGVTKRREQYQGWRQIEAPGASAHFKTAEEAAQFVATSGGMVSSEAVLRDEEARKRAYRAAAAKFHPDTNPGREEEFLRLQQAMAILETVKTETKGARPCR